MGEANLRENHKSAGLSCLLMQPNSADPEPFVRPGGKLKPAHALVSIKGVAQAPDESFRGEGGLRKAHLPSRTLGVCVLCQRGIDLPVCPSPLTLVHHSSLLRAPGSLLRWATALLLGAEGGQRGPGLGRGRKAGLACWSWGEPDLPSACLQSESIPWPATKPPPRAPGPSVYCCCSCLLGVHWPAGYATWPQAQPGSWLDPSEFSCPCFSCLGMCLILELLSAT